MVAIGGWRLKDQDGNVIIIPQHYELGPQKTFRIYSGHGLSNAEHFYAGREKPVWDKEDSVSLTTDDDTQVSGGNYYQYP